jgi:hypothetical protein
MMVEQGLINGRAGPTHFLLTVLLYMKFDKKSNFHFLSNFWVEKLTSWVKKTRAALSLRNFYSKTQNPPPYFAKNTTRQDRHDFVHNVQTPAPFFVQYDKIKKFEKKCVFCIDKIKRRWYNKGAETRGEAPP